VFMPATVAVRARPGDITRAGLTVIGEWP
jgi:hypothetical protein